VLLGLLGIALSAEEAASPPGARPASPLAPAGGPVRDSRRATVVFSDGKKHAGLLWLTPGKRLKIFDRAKQEYREFNLHEVVAVKVDPEEEVMERVWRWKENASDEKVYTGETYPWRKYVTTLTVRDAEGKQTTVTGDVTAELYLEEKPGEKPMRVVLYRRDKGKVGEKLSDLIYVTAVNFDEGKGEGKE
jgi:hypothetical protein